jgi:hypothetical protein
MSTDFCTRAIPYLKSILHEEGETVQLSLQDSPILRPIGNGLLISYLVDQGDHFAYVQHRHLIQSNMTEADLHAKAMENLSDMADEKLEVKECNDFFIGLMDGNLEATLILLDELWKERLTFLAPNGFVAAIPARDILAFCDTASDKGIEGLRDCVARLSSGQSDHRLITNLLHRDIDGEWGIYAN